jgi:RimJ/RimL family protein N-acetyltransferase
MTEFSTEFSTSLERVVAYLERNPLHNIVGLKMLHAHGAKTQTVLASSELGSAALILLPTHAFSYDLEHYPHADGVVLISSDAPELTRALLPHVPAGKSMVFKLASHADALEVARVFAVQRVTSFLSFTDTRPFTADPEVQISQHASAQMLEGYAMRGYTQDWLEPLLHSDHAFCCTLKNDPLWSVCLAFENFGRVWEIGGVYTPPAARGQGLAKRVVHSAVAELQKRNLQARYQVEEDNLASIAVAKGLQLELFLTITHYIARG